MKTVMQNLVSQNVAAMLRRRSRRTPRSSTRSSPSRRSRCSTSTRGTENVDWVAENKVTNIFQGDPSELSYGSGIVASINDADRLGRLEAPATRRSYVVTSNDPYSLTIARASRQAIDRRGLGDVVGFEQFTVPQADWGGTLVKIRRPTRRDRVLQRLRGRRRGVVHQAVRASRRRSRWSTSSTRPSIPEYLKLAGEAANGVLWSTSSADPATTTRRAALRRRLQAGATSEEPGFSNAGDQYDLVKLWARPRAWPATRTTSTRSTRSRAARWPYRGVCGAYTLRPRPGRRASPTRTTRSTRRSAMPHLTFQIQDGKQVLIAPDPYTTGEFQLPDWLA